jgi:hypothetical protein
MTVRARTSCAVGGSLVCLHRRCSRACAHAGDWLVAQLPRLVDVGFKMATGQAEALRPLGLKLLKSVLACFAEAEDPLMQGSRLLDQHQAQFVSALR